MTPSRPVGDAEFEARALAKLRELRLRITGPRREVVHALGQADSPMNANVLFEHLQAAGANIDRVTVYRVLATLNEAGLVHHIGAIDGYLACRIEHRHGSGSEYLICESCGTVRELDVQESVAAATQHEAMEAGFLPSAVRVEIVGLCRQCRPA